MSPEANRIELECEADGLRLDVFLSINLDVSRSRAATIIESGDVLVDGKHRAKNFKLNAGSTVSLSIPKDEMIDAEPENIPLEIFYEDRDIIVVNKPQGMCVHPAPGNTSGTLVNALLFHCKDSLSGINGKLRPGIVHRIDKDTSGLLIVAKNDVAHNALSLMFQNHSFVRKYQAILHSAPPSDEGTVRLAIGRSKKDRKKMAFYPIDTPNTKNATTHYKVIKRFDRYSHVELTLETGRTHQIRVHMLSLSCPVLGDPLYANGRESFGLKGQCLHAGHIGFHHPISGEFLEFDAPLPSYFKNVLSKLEKNRDA